MEKGEWSERHGPGLAVRSPRLAASQQPETGRLTCECGSGDPIDACTVCPPLEARRG